MSYLLISNNTRSSSLDVNLYRGAVRGMSDHYLVEGRFRMAEMWSLIQGAVVGWMHIKVRKLRKAERVLESGEDEVWVGESRREGQTADGG